MARKLEGSGKVERGIFIKRGEYWINYIDQYGKEHKERVGMSLTAARDARIARRADVRSGKFHPEDVGRTPKRLLKDMIESYLKESEATKRTWKDDKRYGNVWIRALGGQPLEAIKAADIEDWRRGKVKDGAKPATINRHVAFLKRVFNIAIRDKKCRDNPVRELKMFKENNERIRFLAYDEEMKLREHIPARFWHYVELAILTGLRQSEQLGLRWENVDFENAVITIPRSKHGETRHIPMSSRVQDILRDRPSRLRSAWVYPGEADAKPIHFSTLRCEFWNAAIGRPPRTGKRAKRAEAAQKKRRSKGLPVRAPQINPVELDLHWHDLRHTFASRLVMKGVDLRTVQELMGHKTILMTQRYAHLAPSHLRKAVDLLCEPDRVSPESDHNRTNQETRLGSEVRMA